MTADQLKPGKILRGPLFAESVEVLVTVPMGDSVKLIGRGLQTGMAIDVILTEDKLNLLETSPDKEPFDGDAKMFRLSTRIYEIYDVDSGNGSARFLSRSGTQDFTYSPLDTPAMPSGGVIF